MYEMRVLLFIFIIFSSVFGQTQKTASYEKFLDEAMVGFGSAAIRLNEEYNLGAYRWDLDQKKGTLTFSENGTPKVIATVQIVGSYSTNSRTWMWAWANDSVRDHLKTGVAQAKIYGTEHKYTELTTAQFKCEEDYGWTLTAAAGYLLKAKGAYRGPMTEGYVYMLITDIKKVA